MRVWLTTREVIQSARPEAWSLNPFLPLAADALLDFFDLPAPLPCELLATRCVRRGHHRGGESVAAHFEQGATARRPPAPGFKPPLGYLRAQEAAAAARRGKGEDFCDGWLLERRWLPRPI